MPTERSGRRGKPGPRACRVWAEVGMTLPVAGDPPTFIRYSFGHERISPTDSDKDIKATEELVHSMNEAVVEKRVKRYARMIRQVQKAEGVDNRPRGRRRS